jgi:hypothetical protein
VGQPPPDFDEIVMFPGRGQMTLRSAIREIMSMSPPAGMIRQTSLFRDRGREATIFDFADIERMAALLDEIEQREARDAKIAARRAEGLSFEEIGQDIGLSRERVRQVAVQLERKAARNARIRARWAGVFASRAGNEGDRNSK